MEDAKCAKKKLVADFADYREFVNPQQTSCSIVRKVMLEGEEESGGLI